MIVDATISPQGAVHMLADDGAIFVQTKPNDIAYQHIAASLRPAFVWERADGPDVLVPTRILIGGQGQLYVVGDGVLFERLRDPASIMIKPVWIWQPVALPGHEPKVPVNPAAPVRTKVATTDDKGSGPHATAGNAEKSRKDDR
jgi:hypothetical protein